MRRLAGQVLALLGQRRLELGERRAAFATRYLDPLIAEARTLGLGPDDIARLLQERAATTMEGTSR